MSDDHDDGHVHFALPKTWPDTGLKPHPFAGIFRMLAGDEKEGFAADIVERGLKERVKVYEDQILDGRNRYVVLVEEGVFDPEVEHWDDRPELFEAFEGSREEALDYVWSLNEQRRHDNASQRAISAERYANLRKVTQAEAAQKFGVSERQVNSAAKVLEEGEPELVQAVEEGRLPLYLAEQVADLDEEDQREVASKAKGEASAAAREKLQDPPPLAESGPVVKPIEPSMLALFAAAVLEVGKAGKAIDLATLDALAREHSLLADRDGVLNLNRGAELAFALARKKLNLSEGDLVGDSLYAVLAADLHDDIELLKADYRQALVGFDQALARGDKERAGEFKLMMEAIVWHSNGKESHSSRVNERPQSIRTSVAVGPGVVPMWGQAGTFEISLDGGLPAIVEFTGDDWGWPRFRFQPTRFDLKFPRGGWVEQRLQYSTVEGDLLGFATKLFADIVARHTAGVKAYPDDTVGMFFPEHVYRIGNDLDPDRVARGIELVDGQWPGPIAEHETRARELMRAWRSGGAAPGGKKRWPKPVHLATHILSVGTEQLWPFADFPENGAYLVENNGRWRYVDDGTDPAVEAVSARLQAAGGIADRTAYAAALAALTEPKGQLHQSTAAEALKEGVAAGVSRAQMAEDLGHPIGTIQTWTARLGLTGLGEGRAAARPRGGSNQQEGAE